MYKPIIKGIFKKKKKKHDKIVFLARLKFKKIEVLIPKALIDSVISHDEFVLINKKYKNLKKQEIQDIFIKTN